MRFLLLILLYFYTTPAFAQSRASSLLIEVDTGRVLMSENPNDKRYPASLAKMMTLYMAFDALEKGQVQMDQPLTVSYKASKQPRSRIGLKANSTISVENALLAMISRSANDAAVVIAEALAGSEAQFSDKMTRVANDLGMKDTRFKNASGLFHKGQVTTAKDMAILSVSLIQHFPQYYRLFAVQGFRFGKRYHGNHNLVARYYRGGDGIKTGYIDASGYHVVGSASRNGKRLIGVVMGRNSVRERDREMFKLLDAGFAQLSGVSETINVSTSVTPEPITDEQKYRVFKIKQQKLSEELDAIASVENSIPKEKTRSVVKTAIVEWGKKKK